MKYYHKIETLFSRSTEGDKSLIEGIFRSNTIAMLADSAIWNFYEKLDGSNHAISWDGHNITLHGRTNKSNIPPHITEYFNNKFNNNETEELFEQLFGESQVVLYFEALGPKVQTYGAKYSNEVQFVLLDVYYEGSDSFASYESLQETSKVLNISLKPLVGHGTLFDAINYVKSVPMSQFAVEQLPMEGVVCVPNIELKDGRTGERLIVKIKGCDHTEGFSQIMKHYK